MSSFSESKAKKLAKESGIFFIVLVATSFMTTNNFFLSVNDFTAKSSYVIFFFLQCVSCKELLLYIEALQYSPT